jgi:NSS family neurotransmitter:Na+ symporter
MFFLLVVLAAISSEISAMEPTIAYLMDEWGWKRKNAVMMCGSCAFLFGIPCALSTSVLADARWHGMTFLDLVDFVTSSILIPVGGFFAVILVGWVWGARNSINSLKLGASDFFNNKGWLLSYFWFCFKYTAPVLIILVFLNALGIFS